MTQDSQRSISRPVVGALLSLSMIFASTAAMRLESAEPSRAKESANDTASVWAPLLDDEVWARLPKTTAAPQGNLPEWARALAGSLPRTTAAMLELDYSYRTSDAFDPKLRARMRWVAARANRCDYSRLYAEADLLRAGGTARDIEQLQSDAANLPELDRAILSFARKMTLDAASVTDQEMKSLVDSLGEPVVVAMVLQMAYANFQDRLLIALGCQIEPEGPLPPLEIRFVAPPPDQKPEPAARPQIPAIVASEVPQGIADAEWSALSFIQLQQRMETQRSRQGRISAPLWETARRELDPQIYPPDRPVRIKWSLVVLGHQPRLGSAWIKCLRTFSREANQDRVFEESIFWVITRSLQCFY